MCIESSHYNCLTLSIHHPKAIQCHIPVQHHNRNSKPLAAMKLFSLTNTLALASAFLNVGLAPIALHNLPSTLTVGTIYEVKRPVTATM